MKKILLSMILGVFLSIGATPVQSISLNFIARGFKHCKGHCDKAHIKCDKKNGQGSYKWCKSKCLHNKKVKKKLFVTAIAHCDAIFEARKLPAFTGRFLGKIIEGSQQYGFLIEIRAQKESGEIAKSGDKVYMHPDKLPKNAKTGSFLDIKKIHKKLLPTHKWGKKKMVLQATVIKRRK